MHGSHKVNSIIPALLLAILLVSVACERETLRPSSAGSFIKFFFHNGHDEGIGVRTIDGGYVMVGNTVTGTSGGNILLIRTDIYGNEIGINKQLGSEDYERANSFTVLFNGGFALLGGTTSGTNGTKKIYLVRTDDQGNEVWSRNYGQNSDETGYSLIETRDGGLVILGAAVDPNTGKSNIRLMKTDSDGDLQWSRTHGGMDDDRGMDITETSYGFIYIGSTRSYRRPGQSGSNIFIAKTNSSGIVTYPYTYGGTGDDTGHKIIPVPGGGYVIMGMTIDPATGIKNILLGQIGEDISQSMWTSTYGGGINHSPACMKITPEGDYIITGTQELTDENHLIFLLKTDPHGKEIFLRTFGGSGRQRAESIDLAQDGGYIITGSNYSGEHRTITLIKTDSEGRLY
jgi:hypothetical protein